MVVAIDLDGGGVRSAAQRFVVEVCSENGAEGQCERTVNRR